MKHTPRLLRITTVPVSLKLLLHGQLLFFKNHDFDVLAVSADGPERSYFREEGIPHQVVPMTRQITPVQDMWCLIRLIFIIRKFRPDIVHTHTPKAGLLGMMAAWVCRVPVRMHTVAGLPVMEAVGSRRTLLKFIEILTYRLASHVYPNSRGLLQYMEQELGIPVHSNTGKFRIIGKGSTNGINTTFYNPSPELQVQAQAIRTEQGVSPHTIVLGFVGRVVKDKGIREAIAAFKRLQSEEIDVHLMLVGPFEQDLDPLSAEDLQFLQGNKSITLAGFQTDVRPWIMAFDIFIFPSYREGFPNVVMQACALEVPCIVSDINGCNEIISHETTGLIVKPKDATALYHAIVHLIHHPEKRKLFSTQARAFITTHFDQQFIWQELLAEYRTRIQKRFNFKI